VRVSSRLAGFLSAARRRAAATAEAPTEAPLALQASLPAPSAAPPSELPELALPSEPVPERRTDELETVSAAEVEEADAAREQAELADELVRLQAALADAETRLVLSEAASRREAADYAARLHVLTRQLGQARDALGSEMAQRARTENELEKVVDSDPLTGLVSARLFLDRANVAVTQAQRQRQRLAVVALDVDGFADLNDALGRRVGDDLLRSVAALLVQTLRQVDTVARLAGDQFSMLLPGIHEPEDAVRVAEKLRLTLCSPLSLGGQDLIVTASIGIALFPDDGPDTDALLACAQAAAREARATGGDRYRLHAAESAALLADRQRREAELRRALVQGELRLHYQPIVDILDGAVLAVEAFLRWQRPEGLIDACEFLPLADSTGLSLPLGQWALEHACKRVAAWRAAGQVELGLSVNLSHRQIEHPALARLVARALADSGLPARALSLEVAEADLQRRPETVVARLRELRELGVEVVLANFGRGDSSLKQLQATPLDAIKIDRVVVAGIGQDDERRALAAATVSLGHALGLVVVAEGVDSEEQRSRLRDWGCDQLQGRLVAAALAEDECLAFLEARVGA